MDMVFELSRYDCTRDSSLLLNTFLSVAIPVTGENLSLLKLSHRRVAPARSVESTSRVVIGKENEKNI